uniref:NADH dehydrogenase [ubiquinone] 1 alpha subcomplex subunit 12 n=1 Tax=Plectus sambesii TaxID=2011161 RepID=A0A914WNW5_9BILA
MKLTEFFGFDKLAKAGRIIKAKGGIGAAIKQRFLIDQTKVGTLVGTDYFGNRYYEENSHFIPRNRWVEFSDRVWLDYDASQVPPEWHRWLHHSTDTTPTESPPHKEKWVMLHQENNSLDVEKKYIPYSTTRTKIQGWTPGQKKE